jgi:hypothetical protein
MTSQTTCPANMFGLHDWPSTTQVMRGEADRCHNCGLAGLRRPPSVRGHEIARPAFAGRRPRYERNVDVDNEMRIAREFRLYMGYPRVVRRGTFDRIALQFEDEDEAVVAWGKAISRTIPLTRYPDYTYSYRKFLDLVQASERTGLPSFLIVEWTDRLGFVRATRSMVEWLQDVGGRIDRGDPEDIETMAHFALDMFEVIRGAETTA